MSVQSVTSTSTATPSADMLGSRSESLSQADFLKMLTTQLKSQDPLNPVSNEEFAQQLATFSSLQELQSIGSTLNDSLQANLLLGQVFNNTMATSLIGKEVRAQASDVTVAASGSANLHYKLDAAATDITIEIQDSDGNVVRTLTPSSQVAGEQTVEWDGLNSDGQHVAAGTYTFKVTAKDGDGNSVSATTYLEGVVSEVRYVNGNVVLLIDGREISLSDVLLIRDPSDGLTKG